MTTEIRQNPGDFVLTFGKHRGCKISDPAIAPSYLEWLSTTTSWDGAGAECRAAVRVYLSSLSKPSSESSLRALVEWSPPQLSHTPPVFWDCEHLWIGFNETRRLFNLNTDQMAKLPLASQYPRMGWQQYWLYHVWDLARVLKGLEAADLALLEFLARYRARMEKVWDEMGLGPSYSY